MKWYVVAVPNIWFLSQLIYQVIFCLTLVILLLVQLVYMMAFFPLCCVSLVLTSLIRYLMMLSFKYVMKSLVDVAETELMEPDQPIVRPVAVVKPYVDEHTWVDPDTALVYSDFELAQQQISFWIISPEQTPRYDIIPYLPYFGAKFNYQYTEGPVRYTDVSFSHAGDFSWHEDGFFTINYPDFRQRLKPRRHQADVTNLAIVDEYDDSIDGDSEEDIPHLNSESEDDGVYTWQNDGTLDESPEEYEVIVATQAYMAGFVNIHIPFPLSLDAVHAYSEARVLFPIIDLDQPMAVLFKINHVADDLIEIWYKPDFNQSIIDRIIALSAYIDIFAILRVTYDSIQLTYSFDHRYQTNYRIYTDIPFEEQIEGFLTFIEHALCL